MQYVFDTKTKTGTLTTSATELIDMLDLEKEYTLPGNVTIYNRIVAQDPQTIRFRGGTSQDLKSQPDMTPFIRELETLQSSKLSKFKTSTGHANTRRRVMSEHDGDWSHERRWDIRPFSATHREQSAIRIVKIHANMTFSAMYSAEQVNKYGATIWALSQLIESRGIQTSIEAVLHTYQYNTGYIYTKVVIPVKDSLKYVSPQELASVFRCVFVRTAMFNGIVNICERENVKANDGLGECQNNPIEYKDDTLFLNIGALNNFDQVTNELTKILGA